MHTSLSLCRRDTNSEHSGNKAWWHGTYEAIARSNEVGPYSDITPRSEHGMQTSLSLEARERMAGLLMTTPFD